MSFLTITEQNTLNDINRIIDWYKNNKRDLTHLEITKKQYNAINRLAKKAQNKPVYGVDGEVEINIPDGINAVNLQGVQLSVKKPARRSYRKKDTRDFISE